MSLLTYTELCELVERGVIQNAEMSQVNAASIDIRLGESMMMESVAIYRVDITDKQSPVMHSVPPWEGKWVLPPGYFALANTMEVFNLPSDIAGEYKLKSSLARSGLQHLLAGWCDPGWHGSTLTLELTNVLKHHALILRPGMKIGQMVFWRGSPVPEHASYAARGRYNRQTAAQVSKGVE